MRLTRHRTSALTLVETMISATIAAVIIGAIVMGGAALQRVFAAADDYYQSTADQMRILDYIARDVRRALTVTASGTTLTLTIPDYVDYSTNTTGNPPGTPRTPTVTSTTPSWGVSAATVIYTNAPITVTYTLSGQSIIRQQGAVSTVISKNIDNFQPTYTVGTPSSVTTAITFAPKFSRGNSANARAGTSLSCTVVRRN